jgi:CRISPR-associated protein Cas2
MEVRPGIFLGHCSKRVRDELWDKVTARPPLGYVAQIWSSPVPQGLQFRQYGTSKRMIVDLEGFLLVCVKKNSRRNKNQ